MEIKSVLQQNEFRFNKKFGQNFISDTNLLEAIVCDAGVTKDDVVIEIGAGAEIGRASCRERVFITV